MRFFKSGSRKTRAAREDVLLVCVSRAPPPAPADGVTAEDMIRLMIAFRDAALEVVAEFGGQAFRGVADTLTAAWLSEGPQPSPAYRDLAHALMARTRTALEKVDGRPVGHVWSSCIAMCRGTCTTTTRGGQVVLVLGTPVATVERMAERRPGEGDVILVERSLVGEFDPSDLTDLGDGLYRLET